MNLYEQRSSNIFRTWALVLGFLVLVTGVGYLISWYYGDPAILYVAIVIAVATNFYAYWASDTLVLSLNHARPATREEFFDFYTVTENLAITAGLPAPKLYVIDDPAPNAFATGRDEKHAVVCATTGLLSLMTRPELEGVVAHELSHVKNRDILLMTVAVVLAGFVAIIADIFLRMSFYGGRRDREGSNGVILILGVIGIILAPLAAQLIKLAISRRREYLADASGVLLTRYPEGLASALRKISARNVPMQHASHATAHLFIDEPFGKPEGKMSWIENLFATHPPVEDRISALLGPKA
jgi:heat shock protein HtpX